MAKPLVVRSLSGSPLAAEFVAAFLFVVPLIGLWYCWHNQLDLHVTNPSLNLAIYLSVFLIPLVWAFCISFPRIEFDETDEISLGACNTIQKWPVNWWMMFVMWAVPVFALLAAAYDFFSDCVPHRETLSMSPGRAVVVMAIVLCLGLFYFTMLFDRSENEARLAPEGLRMSLMRFYQWADLHHVSEHGDIYAIYHRIDPGFPAGVLRVWDEEARALLLKALADHQIPLNNSVDPRFTLAKQSVIVGFFAILTSAFFFARSRGYSHALDHSDCLRRSCCFHAGVRTLSRRP
jgi:hypothetical protein